MQASTFPRQHQRQQEGPREDLLYFQNLARGVEQELQATFHPFRTPGWQIPYRTPGWQSQETQDTRLAESGHQVGRDGTPGRQRPDTRAGIFKKSMGARHRGGIGFLYRPARLHRLAEFIPWNQCRGPINI
jgi:hypothetical protein